MRVKKPADVFNLMDTNGRRDDVIHALNGYLSILDELLNDRHMRWRKLPEGNAQFLFYREALKFSEGVFKDHKPYDFVMQRLEENDELKTAVIACDTDWLNGHRFDYPELFRKIDNGIEDRARHYTSTLVKLGFTDSGRKVTEAGDALLGKIALRKDEFERLLPLNYVNIIYLRQLLKLRIFTSEGDRYYSPFCFAVYALLRRGRLSQNEFAELIQSQNPYRRISDIDGYIDHYQEGDYKKELEIDIPPGLTVEGELDNATLRRYFRNRKSGNLSDIYVQFYHALYAFYRQRTPETLAALLTVCEENKTSLSSAFGQGKSIFSVRRGERPSVDEFLANEAAEFFEGNINCNFYRMYSISKQADKIRENSDTTRRIFKATGLISFDHGYVELAYKELCRCMFDRNKMRTKAMGNMEDDLSAFYDCYAEYEGEGNSFYHGLYSTTQILEIDGKELEQTIFDIRGEFAGAEVKEIPLRLQERRSAEFKRFVDERYPKERVKRLLGLFSDRTNDAQIKSEVCTEAAVPTIYEYVVGLAWYYFSGKSIDLLESYRLTLSADFEPISFAGGGAGDIVIRQEDQVIMLEATLMNANSQKRGEWEPVLRHSVNLKIEEEERGSGREVTTFFVADTFDCNTINIWKAVSSVPLQSSVDKEKFTDHVIIMPINNEELAALMDRSEDYREMIERVRELFAADETKFDMGWRDQFIREVIK